MMKKTILSLGLASSSVFAINLGIVSISPEVGGTVSYTRIGLTPNQQDIKDAIDLSVSKDRLTLGGYARVWIEALGITIAPQVKYDRLPSLGLNNKKINNLQYGGLLGYRIPIIGLTPFVGASYSTFSGGGEANPSNTYALNFGVRLEVPFIPLLTLGLEGSWQKPDLAKRSKVDMLNLGIAVGLSF